MVSFLLGGSTRDIFASFLWRDQSRWLSPPARPRDPRDWEPLGAGWSESIEMEMYPIGSMYAIYMVTFTINIPPMLAYIPYMDPMGMEISFEKLVAWWLMVGWWVDGWWSMVDEILNLLNRWFSEFPGESTIWFKKKAASAAIFVFFL